MFDEELPILSELVDPPIIQGAAPLAALVADGTPVDQMIASLSGPFATEHTMLAAAFDTSVLAFLSARRDLGLALQHDVLATCRVLRMAPGPGIDDTDIPLRVLAFAAPGDLQMNMPIEFITHHLNVRLDMLYVLPNQELPRLVPDHDVAICIISDSDPGALMRLIPILNRWPRPVLNNPGHVAEGRIEDLTRDGIARLFATTPGIMAPATVWRTRTEIAEWLQASLPIATLVPGAQWPLLVRPVGSHAGRMLERLNNPDELKVYIDSLSAGRFYLSSFVDYRSPDGFYRKHRVALIDGSPMLCHMAISDHWMIHYLNAGMTESTAKRADEALAMANFDQDFGHRHRDAFAALHCSLGLDYVILDCGEAPDGRLLLFEVEMAAIVHLLDPIALFAYKQPQMRRVFRAFSALLDRIAATRPGLSPGSIGSASRRHSPPAGQPEDPVQPLYSRQPMRDQNDAPRIGRGIQRGQEVPFGVRI